MATVREMVRVDGREFWTLFDTGARNSYVVAKVANMLTTSETARPIRTALGGRVRETTRTAILEAQVQGHPVSTHAMVIDEIGTDEDGRRIEILFGAPAVQQWGIRPIPEEERLDLTHYPEEFIEFQSSGLCMRFRIRNMSTDDEVEFTRREELYREHLSRFDKILPRDLRKFFWWDFFHDGEVEGIHAQGDLGTVVIRLDCPNIKRMLPGGDFAYVDARFKCTFRNVSAFNFECEEPNRDWDLRANPAVFLDAEINTSPLLDALQSDDEQESEPHHSLLIRLLAHNAIFWLELVFSEVDVVADEPTAFALMESDPRFQVPTYSKDRDGPTDRTGDQNA